MAVLLVGTLDTKGTEFAFVRDLLRAGGGRTSWSLDAGVLGPPAFAPDIPREQVFAAAGSDVERVAEGRRPRPGRRGGGTRRGGDRARPARAGQGRRRPRPGRLGRHHHRHRGHAGPAVRRAQAHGQHAGQRAGASPTSASATS